MTDELIDAIEKEIKRRELKHIARCKYCGEHFVNQPLEYLIEHRKICEGKEEN